MCKDVKMQGYGKLPNCEEKTPTLLTVTVAPPLPIALQPKAISSLAQELNSPCTLGQCFSLDNVQE